MSNLQEFFADESHWTKGAKVTHKEGKLDCACLFYAMLEFYPEHPKKSPYKKLVSTIEELYKDRFAEAGTIGNFNDHPNTTIDDIRKVVQVANA